MPQWRQYLVCASVVLCRYHHCVTDCQQEEKVPHTLDLGRHGNSWHGDGTESLLQLWIKLQTVLIGLQRYRTNMDQLQVWGYIVNKHIHINTNIYTCLYRINTKIYIAVPCMLCPQGSQLIAATNSLHHDFLWPQPLVITPNHVISDILYSYFIMCILYFILSLYFFPVILLFNSTQHCKTYVW